MAIGIFDNHAYLIKDIAKLAKIYTHDNCQERFNASLSPSTTREKNELKVEKLSIAQTSGSKFRIPFIRERSITLARTKLHHHRYAGLSTQASC